MSVLTLHIDGRQVAVPEGASLLEACRGAGVNLPVLCHLDGLTPVAACRLCLVEVVGSGRLLPACAAGLHVHLHGLPLLTGEFPPGQHGMDAHALMQALIGNRRISVLYATEWHAVHNPAGLDALMRGRSAGGGGSLWLLHRPER